MLRIRKGDPIEIFTDGDGVVLKKYARIRELGDYAEVYCQALQGALGFSAAVTDTETVLFASGSMKKQLKDAVLSETYVERMRSRQAILAPEGFSFLAGDMPALRLAAVPIVSAGDVLGSVFIATDDARLKLSDTELSILKTAALYLGKQLE